MSKSSKKKKARENQAAIEQQNASIKALASKGKSKWYIAALLLITGILFTPSLKYELVEWDDNINLYSNKALNNFGKEWKWQDVKTIFTSDVSGSGNYNPLPIFTFALEKHFVAPNPRENPFIFHFNNLWMHLLCTVLVFLLFQELGLGMLGAFLGALLFGIHPMRVESVVWVTERKDVLYGMFFIAALLMYLRYARDGAKKWQWYSLALVFSIFSYFAKIQAVTLPLTMVAIDFFIGRKWYSFKTLVVEKLPWWGLSLAIGLINVYFLNTANIIQNVPVEQGIFDKLAIGAYSYYTYLVKFIYPYQMLPIYGYPGVIPTIYYVTLVAVPVAIVAFLYIAWKRKYKHAIFGWAFFTFNVMFLLQIVTAGQGFLADRFTYIAYIGLFFILAYGLEYLIKKIPDFKTLFYGAAAMALVFYFYLSTQQMKIWQNTGTLWAKEMKERPDVDKGYLYGGQYARDQQKDILAAKEIYLAGTQALPYHSEIRNGLGESYFTLAMQLSGQNSAEKARLNMLIDSALLHMNVALSFDSTTRGDSFNVAKIYSNRCVCYSMKGNYTAALQDCNMGIKLAPENKNGYVNRALIFINTARYDMAIKDFDTLLKLTPNAGNIYLERGVCKYRLQQNEAALQDLNMAVARGHDKPVTYLWRARTHQALGNREAMLKDALFAKQNGLEVEADMLQ